MPSRGGTLRTGARAAAFAAWSGASGAGPRSRIRGRALPAMRSAFASGLVALSLGLGLGLGAHAAAAAAPSDRMPAFAVATLDGRALHLPDALPPCPVLLVIGFSRGSRTQTTAWSQRVEGGDGCGAGLAVYQVVVLDGVPALFRGAVVRGIRGGVPAALRPRFLLAESDIPGWRALAGAVAPDDAVVVLLDRARRVAWRHAGAPDAAAERALRAAIAGLPEP